MKFIDIRYLMLSILSILSFPSFSGSNSEYGDIIKDTPEYKKITTKKSGGHDNDDHHERHYNPYPHYPLGYPSSSTNYRRSSRGIPGHLYLGVAIGESKFDYDDIDDGDASIIHFGYRPKDSRLGYEVSFYDSGDSEVTSLTDIEIQVETINLVITANSSMNNRSTLNLFGQGGIYFAETTLSGPADSVSEKSNGFLLAAGVEISVNKSFSLRAEAFNLFDVEDFANDESVSFFSLGGQYTF